MTQKKSTILVVDDDRFTLSLIHDALASRVEVKTATNAADALALLDCCAQREEQCRKDALDLADTRNTPRLYDLNDKGERVFLSDKEREDRIAAAQKAHDEHCK